ncbi:MAG: hypothetical protein H0T89_32380 [Deltaproteobacteria bacterium]|nr:hypothetical protein [Deltaproteobacteria bacterium]MDQ3299381.1 hypothetical protein [Myxococcota bacterium]
MPEGTITVREVPGPDTKRDVSFEKGGAGLEASPVSRVRQARSAIPTPTRALSTRDGAGARSATTADRDIGEINLKRNAARRSG